MSSLVTPIQCLKRKKGKSKPHLIRCSDGQDYLIKFKDNPQGTRTLVNDYIVSQLGRLLGLPIPPSAAIYITDDFIQSCSLFDKYDFKGGHQFSSLYLNDCITLTKEEPFPLKDQIMNQVVLSDIFLFDLWVSNRDRWKGNILFQPTKDNQYLLYLVDHSDCFPGSSRWTTESLRKKPRLKKLRSVHKWCLQLMKSSNDFHSFIQRIKQLPNDQIKSIIHSIPPDWEVSKKEQDALLQHLVRGKKKLPKLINDYIPNL